MQATTVRVSSGICKMQPGLAKRCIAWPSTAAHSPVTSHLRPSVRAVHAKAGSEDVHISPHEGMFAPGQDIYNRLSRAHLVSPAVISGGSFLALTQTPLLAMAGLDVTGAEPVLSAFLGIAAYAFLRAFSQTVPYSQRDHLVLVPEEVEKQIGQKSFNQVLQQYGKQILPKSHPDAQMVERIGRRVIQAVQQADKNVVGYQDHMKDYEWEIFAVDSKTPNAFVVPGGKIVVFTGLMDILRRDEDAMAVVISHEVAHVVARHSAERIGLKILTTVLTGLITYYILSRGSQQQQRGRGGRGGAAINPYGQQNQMISSAVSQGAALLVELPGSRRHEMEADLVGLKLAGLAGYDIRKAPGVWEAMGAQEGGRAPAAWQSTHPASSKRQQVLARELELMRKNGLEGKDAYEKVFAKTSYLAL